MSLRITRSATEKERPAHALLGKRVERLEAALSEMPAVQATKRAGSRTEARVFTTDTGARVMKMADSRAGFITSVQPSGRRAV
jgi:hypothetical protein